MGVQGLWRLLDATGKQVPLETLEGKILAVDVSIWIHQVLQGYQDRFGNSKPNAHLIGLFNRICKLLYYKIKPVFVFDGGVPMLKKDTIALRRNMKSMAKNKAQQMRIELINNLIKHSVVKTVLNTEEEKVGKISSEIVANVQTKQTADDMFKLPDLPSTSKVESDHSDDSDSSINLSPRKQTRWIGNIHNVDVTSADFKALPADVRYDILTDLKETRKQNSWGRLHEMPEETHEFSGFQMRRLLKRRLVQQNLETAEKEMGGKTLTLDELDKLLTEQGVNTSGYNCTYRVAADNSTRLLYISDKNAYIKSTSNDGNSQSENTVNNEDKVVEPVPGSSKAVPICEDINEYEFDNEWDSDVEITATNNSKLTVEEMSSDAESEVELNESRRLTKKYLEKNVVNPALTYMLEYSGLTEKQILALLEQNKKKEGYEGTRNTSKESEQTEFANLNSTESTQSPQTELSESNTESNIISQSELSESNTESNIRSQTELSESNTELDTNASLIKVSNALNIEQIKSIDTAIISSTDSDTDDFVEIQDVLIPDVDTDGNKSASKEGIQITFRSDQKIEDDIFADVFETSNSKSDAEIKSQNVSLSSEFSEKLVESFSGSQETLEDTVIPQEGVVKTIQDKIKDQQLPDPIKMDNTEKQPVENDENTDTQLQTDPTKLTNIENITNYETNSAEITNIQDSTTVDVPPDDSRRISPLPVNEDELLSLKTRLEAEQTELAANIGKFDRQGINISNQIRIESQELLRLFGIPYIVAPMEAEAQCAYLEQIHLTDGTITDDSDIWLFGGQCVYKNFFDNDKKVLEYCSNDIHHHFKLTRSEMIRLALLVGSDYTTGLPGIGPVTALEILAAFPSEGDDLLRGLTTFCSWIKSGRAVGPGKAALRNKLQNVQIHKGFPSQAVVQAYLFPEVDESKESFTWGKLNTLLLSDYTRQKFGWTKEKFDKIITPVLNRMEEKQSQKTINAYFKVHTVPKSIEMNMSKRVQKAVQQLSNPNAEEAPESMLSKLQQMKRTKSKPPNENRKKKTKSTDKQDAVEPAKRNTLNVPVTSDKYVEEYIPQREKDKEAALKKRLNAIEVLRKSKQGLYKTKKVKRCVRKVKKEAGLSESDSSSS